LKSEKVLCFNSHFPGEPGLASFIEAKDGGSGGNNWSYKTCRAPVKLSPPTPNVSQARCPSCLPANSVKALKGKLSHSTDFLKKYLANFVDNC